MEMLLWRVYIFREEPSRYDLESEKWIVCWNEQLNMERNLFANSNRESNREQKWLLEMLGNGCHSFDSL